MAKILVTYASMAGSTAEVAEKVGAEIARHGYEVDVRPIKDVQAVEGYAGVVVGGPMIMGWHREALGFVKRHRPAWGRIPLAAFVLALSLTETGERSVEGLPITVDPKLPKPPATPGKLNFRERYARLGNYLRPLFQAAQPARPATVGVFGGRMEYGRLKWWAVLFAMVLIRVPAGERRNWEAIQAWAAGVPAAFGLVGASAVIEAPGEAVQVRM